MPYTDFHYTPTGTGVISGKEVLEQTEDAINDLGTQISGDVQTAIDTANNALNTANTASADAQNAVNTANTAYTTATNAQNTANAAQNTASNALTAAQNAQNDVNALGNRVTTAEGNISQNTNAITGLTTRMGTAEGNITTLQNDVVTAQGTATSAQNTATMARQQSYVFRYSSTALVASSTNSDTLLDNTDNLKVGDKVIDSNGVLFSITAIDNVNSTFTVGSPLIDLALDANVVHTSGNETKSGELTLSDTLNSSDIVPIANNSYSLGNSSNKWKQINGINPGALSFPDLNNAVDISGYITAPNAVSTYTPVVNGWVSIVLKSTSGALGCFATQGDFANGHYSATSLPNETEPCVMLSMPVIGGIAVNIYTKGTNAYLYSAKFFPCLGNV